MMYIMIVKIGKHVVVNMFDIPSEQDSFRKTTLLNTRILQMRLLVTCREGGHVTTLAAPWITLHVISGAAVLGKETTSVFTENAYNS